MEEQTELHPRVMINTEYSAFNKLFWCFSATFPRKFRASTRHHTDNVLLSSHFCMIHSRYYAGVTNGKVTSYIMASDTRHQTSGIRHQASGTNFLEELSNFLFITKDIASYLCVLSVYLSLVLCIRRAYLFCLRLCYYLLQYSTVQ